MNKDKQSPHSSTLGIKISELMYDHPQYLFIIPALIALPFIATRCATEEKKRIEKLHATPIGQYYGDNPKSKRTSRLTLNSDGSYSLVAFIYHSNEAYLKEFGDWSQDSTGINLKCNKTLRKITPTDKKSHKSYLYNVQDNREDIDNLLNVNNFIITKVSAEEK